MFRKIGAMLICMSLILVGNVFGEGACSGDSKGSSGKAGSAQVMTFKKGSFTLIGELGSIIVSDDNGLVVKMAGQKENRPAKYRDIDLRDSDRIIMLNGKKMTAIQEFEDGYKAVGIGQDVELGVKRGTIMMIVSFPKASPDDLPRMQAMIISEDGGEIKTVETVGDSADIGVISIDGSKSIRPIAGAGLIIAEKDDNVVVLMLLPNATDLMKGGQLEKGDIILSLQGQEISSTEQFSLIYEEIPVGSKVEIRYSRDGETGTANFEKLDISENPELRIEK